MGSGRGSLNEKTSPSLEMSNRSLRNSRRRRFARRQRGGAAPFGGAPNSPAFGVGNMDTLTGSFAGASTTGAGSGVPVPISSWGPANSGCDVVPRTDSPLHTQANPDIAGTNQYPILGGNIAVPPFSSTVPPISNAVQMPPSDMNARQMGGTRSHRHRRGGPCPVCGGKRKSRKQRNNRKQRGGGCGCMMRQSGGGSPQGLSQFPDVNALSGGGPNVGNPVNQPSGCLPPAGISDVRGGNNAAENGGPMGAGLPAVAPAHTPAVSPGPVMYNAQGMLQQVGGRRRKQRGGSAMSIASAAPLDNAFPATPQPSYGAANAFPESCYKAPGSEMPVYNANSASFNFSPSITANNTLPPGVNVYNQVDQQPGRMGAPEPAAIALQGVVGSSQVPAQRGGRRSRRNRRNNRKNSRKSNRKDSRKSSRKDSRKN